MSTINIQAIIDEQAPDKEKCETTQANSSFSDNTMKLEIWKQLYKRYTSEIETLWQRSIFLATFIVLAFTGYGCYVKAFDTLYCQYDIELVSCHLLGLALGVIISILGFLWIAMIKGSKFWCENYEKKISLLENSIFTSDLAQFKLEYCEYIKDNVDERVVNLGAGRCSPSQINILLGWLIHICGAFITLIHILAISKEYFAIPQVVCLTVMLLIDLLIIGAIDWLLWYLVKGGKKKS